MRIVSDSITRRYLAIVGIVLIMATLVTGIPGSYGVSGNDPDSSENLEIYTWYDLDAVRDSMSGNHTLMNDLDSSTPGYTELASPTANGGEGWQPIGYSMPAPASCKANPPVHLGLSGTFDGQGHEIRDMFILPDEFAVGLFAYLLEGGIIKNLGVTNVTVVGYNVVGSLVGYNEGGTIISCYSTVNVTGHADVGGLVGRLYEGNIVDSYSTGSVNIDESPIGIGGLVGKQYSGSTISNCYSTCSLTGGSYVGPVGRPGIGGLVGTNYNIDNVISSFWDIETSGYTTSAGGTGKNTTEMQDVATFSAAGWNITAVSLNQTNPSYIWNIVNNVTYPFLGWQS